VISTSLLVTDSVKALFFLIEEAAVLAGDDSGESSCKRLLHKYFKLLVGPRPHFTSSIDGMCRLYSLKINGYVMISWTTGPMDLLDVPSPLMMICC